MTDRAVLLQQVSVFFSPCLSVSASTNTYGGQEGDGLMDGWWVGSGDSPLALLCSQLLPHSRPEVVGILLTCNPSHCLAASSWVTCHSLWHESALMPADLSCFAKSVNRTWVHGPQAKWTLNTPPHPPPTLCPKTTGCCQMTQKSVVRHVCVCVRGRRGEGVDVCDITQINCEMTIK